ncbi:MAG TPA: copper homeostasis protein CutC [Erwinia persicina]|uniref:PF03932 family protein CutC n=1 Tax=Erwinia persicina TaxID=55211 RepID=A0A356YQF5_9GAMM|nr:copper homeostasis protein CutC [Erwinia persicina]AXU97814.1 copper homeostasis protein CutC [Erwinia persicina]MBC3943738.1 copper homeostasis protein CutC [Erwinia persicina]MBD8104817.1 copper homeostasis protein CutC [Erwinia persicina]MBD8167037.1 copper homeostasis protein CutC [Erwinia persicina]MBD8207963.1 copper homeostasis protein CutC [Erwinia persicina]
MRKLEICCYGVECAVTAEKAGADRVELCAAPAEGGLTPSAGTLMSARQRVSIPVHPIVRPRGGDFCYSEIEFEQMKSDIDFIRELGFPGLVVGLLDIDGHIDLPRMQQVMKHCQGMAVTFHRAFDLCHSPLLAMTQLTDLGVARILTSGQQQSAESGLPLLRELTHKARGLKVMAGAGVRLSNVQKFIDAGVIELHSSASQRTASPMRYRKAGVSMCSEAENDEFTRTSVDGDVVAAMKSVMSFGAPVKVA